MLQSRSMLGARAAQRAGGRSMNMALRASSSEETTSVVPTPRTAYKLQGPQPQRFTVADGQMALVATAAAGSIFRLGMGLFNHGYSVSLQADDGKYAVLKPGGQKVAETSLVSTFNRPQQPLELYEFETCPFCKKVREAITILDLDVLVRPCPKDGATWRPEAIAKGGKRQFPFLVDPNTGQQMYESDEIIRYLFNTYGPGEAEIPFMLKAGFLTTLTCGLGLLPSGGRGGSYRKSKLPAQPIVFYGYEGSPFVKIVREALCELEVPYLQKTTGRGSPKRQELIDNYGHFQVPFIEDPNTGIAMFESKDIVQYLRTTYGTSA